jgi:trehalose/maltose hydrolase-like predicted phosphorylase
MGEWSWEYEGYDPTQEKLRESLCTLGNGYFATRGAIPECARDRVHYPGTYVAGCYNRLVSDIAGRHIDNEDVVNLPNWLPLRFRTGTGHWFTPDTHTVEEYRQSLDLRRGVLERTLRYVDADGRALRVRQLRVVHMADRHLALLRTELTPEGWSGALEIESALDAGVTNGNVDRYKALASQHLTHIQPGAAEDGTVWVRCRTTTSDIRVALAARTEADAPAEILTEQTETGIARLMRLSVADGHTVTVDKTVALHTSRDPAISDPLHAALDRVGRAGGFETLLDSHRTAWEQLWRGAEIDVPGEAGPVLRVHLFHLLQVLSPHTAELDVGVPARGLHGEAYRGHVFWDELFVLPFLNLHFPEVSRALLTYRHRRLERARFNATDAGYRGALYPWQSGSDGREETQRLHLNPRSGRWLPDHSHLQYHVGSAVAYNVWRYAEATADTGFLYGKGADILLQVARFWADFADYDKGLERYRIRGVVGPDEYHEAYPGATRPGLDDNAYTNVTASWVISRALDLLDALPAPLRRDIAERTGVDDTELEHWDDVSRRLHVPFHSGVVSQFAGYGDLEELDWHGYRVKYGDIRRLDRIMEAEGDTVNRYQASKQADVLMLGYLFPPGELRAQFRRLGHDLDDETWLRTVDHYLARTSHGSTLSSLVHGWVLARARRAQAWEFVQEALAGDIADVQGGTTGEGIHLGAMAGTLDLVQRCLPGLETGAGALRFDPVPLPQMERYRFCLRYRGHWGVRVQLRQEELEIAVAAAAEEPVTVHVGEWTESLAPGETRTVPLRERRPGA